MAKDLENYAYMNAGKYSQALDDAKAAMVNNTSYKGMSGDTLANWVADVEKCCKRDNKKLHPEFAGYPPLEGYTYANKATVKKITPTNSY